jgi:hypothetical protein
MTQTAVTEASVAPARRRPLAGLFRRATAKGPPVVHPFLMAAYPIVFLFAQNLHEAITPNEMIRPLELSLGVVAILMVAAWAIFRNAKAVGLVASAWVLLFFSYGRVASGLEGSALGRDRYLLAAWAALAVGALVVAFVLRSRLAAATRGLNLVTAALVLMNLVPILLYRPAPRAGASATLSGEFARALTTAKGAVHQRPDIYYIMPEDYGQERTLRDKFGVETHPFVQYLEKQGFFVAGDTKANYQETHNSLAASVNMQYLPALLGAAAKDVDAVKATVRGFVASRFLKGLGYRYVHMGFWWAPTATDPTADVEVKSGSLSEFSSILYDTTILPTLSRRLDVEQKVLDPRRARYEQSRQELDDIVSSAKLRGPKFVFAHIGLPHFPYVFDRDGNFVPKESGRVVKKFADQAYFTTRALQDLVGRLLDATDRKAVIILQTDEGPLMHGARTDIATGKFERKDLRAELLDKYRILNAYFLPGVSRDRLYPSITPVNSFRLVFDLYFHAGLGLLPDQVWAKEVDPPRFVEITQLVEER